MRNPATVAETVEVIEQHPHRPRVEVATLAEVDQRRPADVVASTVPVEAQSGELLRLLEPSGAPLVFDAIYDPWPTPLATWAADSGRAVVSGLDLLCHQAALQVALMTQRTPSVAVMREAGVRALAARHRDAE